MKVSSYPGLSQQKKEEKNLIEVNNLVKRYGDHKAVDHLSFSIEKGKIYGFLGPNGAGKSTVLKMLTGLIRPSAGEVVMFGELWHRKHLRRLGALIESPALYGNLTAVENLRVHTMLMGLPDKEIDRVLEIVDLKNTGKKLIAKFSTGMKQRLGIAIALLGSPELVILDEPTNGLDPLGIQELRGLIRSFPSMGMTVIVSSHILTEVAQIVDHLGIISDGQLKYQGPIDPQMNLEELFFSVVRGER